MRRRAELEGTIATPGCKCVLACEFPCHQRIGLAPACQACGCPPLLSDDQGEPDLAA